jgi:molybdopterin-guanine dinucleotide biosynthesis protein A
MDKGIEGVVLAGGSARRMGQPKAFLPFKESNLLRNAAEILRNTGLNVTIVVSELENVEGSKFPVICDLKPGSGPLGGIHTALKGTKSSGCCVLACDLPLVTPAFFRILIEYATGFDAVVPYDQKGYPQPLCAYYSSGCLEPIENLLVLGKRKVREVLSCDSLQIRKLEASEHRMPDSMFLNINTREDYQRLLEYASSSEESGS